MGFFSDIHHLPLSWRGLHNIPAVPVELEGLLDTACKLYERSKETEPAKQGLTNKYTINATKASGLEFLYGERPKSKLQDALTPLIDDLDTNTTTVLSSLYDSLSDDDVDDNVAKSLSPLESLSLDSADQWTISWTNHDDIYEKYKHLVPEWAATLTDPDEASSAFWPMIANNGFAYNLLILKKVEAIDLPGLKRQFGRAWLKSWEKLSSEGLLFAIDLTIFSKVDTAVVNGFDRFTPSTVTLLRQNEETKDLEPFAVRVAGPNDSGKQVFKRSNATDSAWLYALQAAKVSVTVYGIWLGHVYHWHMVTAAMQMTMYNNLDEDHPVYKLVAPQANYLFQFDELMLLLWDHIAPPTSFATAWSFLELMDIFAEDRDYFDDDPMETLNRQGLWQEDFTVNQPWDKYPIVAKFLKVWHAVADYVAAFVDNTYANDALVAENEPLQAWIRDSSGKSDGNIKGLPQLRTRQDLKRVLTSLIYRITVHGSSRLQRSAYPAQAFVANYPPCLQRRDIPRPNVKLSTAELMEYMPKTGTIGEMMTFYTTFVFSSPYVPFIPKKGVKADLFFPGGQRDPRNKALIAFREKIIAFMREYEPESSQFGQWPLNIET